MNPFEQLLKELSYVMDVPLHSDEHQSCVIQYPNSLLVQIDLCSDADFIVIGTTLGILESGVYRERLFKAALMANRAQDSIKGILAYNEKKMELVLFQKLPIQYLNGEKLFQFLETFTDQAKTWTNALQRGDVPQLQEESSTGSGFFGLRR